MYFSPINNNVINYQTCPIFRQSQCQRITRRSDRCFDTGQNSSLFIIQIDLIGITIRQNDCKNPLLTDPKILKRLFQSNFTLQPFTIKYIDTVGTYITNRNIVSASTHFRRSHSKNLIPDNFLLFIGKGNTILTVTNHSIITKIIFCRRITVPCNRKNNRIIMIRPQKKPEYTTYKHGTHNQNNRCPLLMLTHQCF